MKMNFETNQVALEFYRMSKASKLSPLEALNYTERLFGPDACDIACEAYKQDVLSRKPLSIDELIRKEQEAALRVISETPAISAWLEKNDPKALQQVRTALL